MSDAGANVDRLAAGWLAPSTGQVLLGLFIVTNIGALLIMNGLGFVKDLGWMMAEDSPALMVVNRLSFDLPRDEGPALETYKLARRWGEVTAQCQSWCLFAPWVAEHWTFAELEVRWDDRLPGRPPAAGARQPLLLLNDGYPDDLTDYFRLGNSRFRKYENNVIVRVYRYPDEPEEDARLRWARAIRARFREQTDTIQAYLGWRWRKLRDKMPDLPEPRQIILLSRGYRTPPPGREPWMWEGPFITAVARWRPENGGALDMFDPRSQAFVMREQALK
jgi:hypothetical protein